MKTALVTGAGGLIGSESVRHFSARDFRVVGIDNNMRAYFFGPEGSTETTVSSLERDCPHFTHIRADIRNEAEVTALFRQHQFDLVIHTAAQPSHDWAAREPMTDFTVNANGTLVLLEALRLHAPDAVFIFTSTNKVYGDNPNRLPMVELETRWEIEPGHAFVEGIDESMSTDQCLHSLFGVSKLAADVMVQEYGRYFGLKTGVFRGGCLTGPGHKGVELHGFLSYLVKAVVSERPYRIFGYGGKQVRDNIHSEDLINAFYNFYLNPRPGEVYNMGGGRYSNCSLQEAVQLIERMTGQRAITEYQEAPRRGDHIWYISNLHKFQNHYPAWKPKKSLETTLDEILAATLNARTAVPLG